ncbi:MAG: XRE family transcriptional regulator [Cupriavidus sp.]|nr:MAG: XRE family transcriptional regulator [Cupriavidus sp.]
MAKSISGGPPDAVDVFVGGRVRALRKARGISQTALADEIGPTLQQVQKYERGFNRISASVLYRIAGALDAVPAEFFAGLPDPPRPSRRRRSDPGNPRKV